MSPLFFLFRKNMPSACGIPITADDLHIFFSIAARRFEYKTRERIQRRVADRRLLAIPASWSRVADSNPN